MADDSYETVAITYGQPETVVMLSMFAWYGMPAYASGLGHAQVWPFAVALGGMEVRVHPDSAADAHALLAESTHDGGAMLAGVGAHIATGRGGGP